MVRWLALLLFSLTLAGCGSKPAPYLGTWKSGPNTLTLNSDGVMVVNNPAGGEQGRWKDIGSGKIEASVDARNYRGDSKWWVSDDGKTLTLTPVNPDGSEGTPVTYQRQ